MSNQMYPDWQLLGYHHIMNLLAGGPEPPTNPNIMRKSAQEKNMKPGTCQDLLENIGPLKYEPLEFSTPEDIGYYQVNYTAGDYFDEFVANLTSCAMQTLVNRPFTEQIEHRPSPADQWYETPLFGFLWCIQHQRIFHPNTVTHDFILEKFNQFFKDTKDRYGFSKAIQALFDHDDKPLGRSMALMAATYNADKYSGC